MGCVGSKEPVQEKAKEKTHSDKKANGEKESKEEMNRKIGKDDRTIPEARSDDTRARLRG